MSMYYICFVHCTEYSELSYEMRLSTTSDVLVSLLLERGQILRGGKKVGCGGGVGLKQRRHKQVITSHLIKQLERNTDKQLLDWQKTL